ncbi:MAG: ArsR family transcriptional regulator [Anaerolineaceae bacterium]|nr:MAG: ArsR family transcriptional regulator [Anaerolineaceae bacterium]
MPFNLNLEKTAALTVALEPARNALASMLVLAKDEDMPGITNWIQETRNKMSAEEKFQHKLVVLGFYHIISVDESWNSFADYLASLSNMDPLAMRSKMLDAYANMRVKHSEGSQPLPPVDWNTALASAENYVDFLIARFGEEYVDREIEARAYEYVIDPPAMKSLIVDYLQNFWEMRFRPEWERVENILQESVQAFQSTDFTRMDQLEAARFITGQDLAEEAWRPALEKAHQIIFIPNAHIGPYVTRLPDMNSLIVIFGARTPDNAATRIPDLDRADIIARLSALADETRLQILQMVRNNEEMRAQEIIEATGLSQPSVSRYLGQLTATGYLQERRVNGAKAYSLNRGRITKTLKAVSAFLLGQ